MFEDDGVQYDYKACRNEASGCSLLSLSVRVEKQLFHCLSPLQTLADMAQEYNHHRLHHLNLYVIYDTNAKYIFRSPDREAAERHGC
jgi:hypothetical protein